MAESTAGARERSGCALALGVLLILFGLFFLGRNLDLIGWSSLTLLRSAGVLFSDYWPLVLVLWGAFKVYRRITTPERARVGFLEVIVLLLVVSAGLTMRAARHAMERFSAEASYDPWYELVELELLGAPAYRFTEEATFELPSSNAVLAVENGDGNVSVTVADSDEARVDVELTKRIHERTESDAARFAEGVSLEFDTEAERTRLVVRSPRRGRSQTDLKLTVPPNVSLQLKNRRGGVVVSGVAGAVDVDSAHGDVELRELRGGLTVRAHRADVRAEALAGSVEIRNQHGAVDVRGVQGELSAVTSHGSLVARDVSGSARLENRHAPVRAHGIEGNVEVSGSYTQVSVERASSDVVVRTSHEPIFLRDVSGRVTISSRNATIQVVDAGGDVEVEAEGEPVTVTKARAAVRVGSRPSEVTIDDAAGPVVIAGADGRVRVTSFASDLSIRSSHAELFASARTLGGNVDLESTYGDVELTLTKTSSARIVATTRDGELRASFDGLDFREDREAGLRRWEGTLGSGSHNVSLSSSYGDVRVSERKP